ncbi:DUF945 family protein [Legionella sp. CNM-4043-24]|uniref:DUF945 family protein n=1 Tax=Legionella sp. CNM-4043-24 TaxID=3421646 RepID=UPI00403AF765
MKKWAKIFLSLVVLILASYYVCGRILESTISKNIDAIPDNSLLRVSLNHYQRGWFSSQAQLALSMHVPQQTTTDKTTGAITTTPAADVDVNFPLSMNHGPIIFTDAGIRFGTGHVSTTPETHYQALVSYLNKTILRYTLPSFSVDVKANSDTVHFELGGVRVELRFSPEVDKLDGYLTLNSLKGSDKQNVFQLSELLDDFNVYREQPGLWLGRNHLAIPLIKMNDANRQYSLEDFDLLVSTDLSDGALNAHYDMSLKQLQVADKHYGPASFKLGLTNLEPSAMAGINQASWAMMQNNQHPELFMLGLVAELPKLLSRGVELNLSELDVTFPEGRLTGNLKFLLPKTVLPDPAQMAQQVRGEGQFRVSAAVVKTLLLESLTRSMEPQQAQAQAEQILQQSLSKGLFKVEGDDYVMVIKLENQQLSINGKVMSKSDWQ